MQKANKLDWQKLPWQDFEILTLHLAQQLFHEANFETYLKEGHQQEGIDILSVIGNDGKYILLQCKREKSLTSQGIKNIVEYFVSKSFGSKASTFVLSTTADLQQPALKKFIVETQEKLFAEWQIQFQCWDANFLNEQLRGYKTIVEFFFGLEDATKHCFSIEPKLIKEASVPLPNFIPRKVCLFSETEDNFNGNWLIRQREKFSLSELVRKDRLVSKHLCLIADAHQGKSFLLRQTAWELEQGDSPFQCLFIEIKSHNVKPIREILDSEFPFWQQIPFKDIVIFIDGLDEVPTDQFDEVVRNVSDFKQQFPFITLLFSCRKIFYNYYKVRNSTKQFSTYELYPLQSQDIMRYLKDNLGQFNDQFSKAVSKAGITNFLYHPFYLTNLIKNFKRPPFKVPGSKIEVLENFIDEAFTSSYDRRISGGKFLDHKIVKFRIVIQKLALAMQLAGVNSFTKEDVQFLFDESEIELLEHNSLVTISADRWSFSNALFQEHLAALMLAKMSFAEITKLITVGSQVKKVRTKWIQTISSLLSILSDKEPIRKSLLRLIEQDNVELVFTAEQTKFTDEMRFDAIKKLIKKCIKLDLRPILVYEETIALFIDGDKKSIDFLLKNLNDETITERVKTSICYILKNVSTSEAIEKKMLKIAQKEIASTSNGYYARQLLEIVEAFQLGNREFIQSLLSKPKLSSSHEYRAGLYNLITSLNLVEEFYEYGIDGFRFLIRHNKDITRVGSEYPLHSFLLATRELGNIRKLFHRILEDDWVEFCRNHSISHEEFINKLAETAVEIFHVDQMVVLPVINYVKALSRRSLKEEFDGIETFFDKTKSSPTAIRALGEKLFSESYWEYGSLITPESFDYLLFELEAREFTTAFIWNWIWALRHAGKKGIAEAMFTFFDQATEGSLTKDMAAFREDEYTKVEKQKRINDITYIQDKEKFRVGIVKFFDAYGKTSIPESDIFVEIDGPEIRKKFDSNFISSLLIRWVNQNKRVSLKASLNIVDNPDSFEYFRAFEILHYNFSGDPTEESLKNIIEDYYKKQIVSANFKNAIVQKGDRYTWYRKEKILSEIFQKFEFDTPIDKLMDLVWMDTSGIAGFEHHDANKKKSICQLIIQHLSESELVLFRQRIAANLQAGIVSESILGTHVSLCKHLTIVEAREFILDAINKKKVRQWNVSSYVDVYLHLGGDRQKLVPYFKKIKEYTDYAYFNLINELSDTQPQLVKKSLLGCLRSVLVPGEIKIGAAKYLASMGVNEGFDYLVDLLVADKKAPYSIQGKFKVSNVDTLYAVEKLKNLMFILLDPLYSDEQNFSDAGKNIFLEWLYDFAAKSENDFNKIISLLAASYNDLKNKYSNAKDLFWHAEQIAEKFRDSDKTVRSIPEIKSILIRL